MTEWSLSTLLAGLHDDIHQRLEIARKALAHPVAKGDASEDVWLELLTVYLPQRYQAAKAFVVDSKGNFSDQIDVVIFDRQYSPFIFKVKNQIIVPAESVYAVFESKQTINAEVIEYAQKKVSSVRKLYQTSLPIPHAGGTYPPKPPIQICAGILSFESDWNPALGKPMLEALTRGIGNEQLDLGCVAAQGHFYLGQDKQYVVESGGKPATAFLFKLISQLQMAGTVPMIDVQAYAQWIAK